MLGGEGETASSSELVWWIKHVQERERTGVKGKRSLLGGREGVAEGYVGPKSDHGDDGGRGAQESDEDAPEFGR